MIYLDNASTTKMYDEVLKRYLEISTDNFYNASALYSCGLKSKNLINESSSNSAETTKGLSGCPKDTLNPIGFNLSIFTFAIN